MHLIKSTTVNRLLDAELDRISKSMVNIYWGTNYYTPMGVLEKNPTPDYLSWECETMSYEFVPIRGYIYLNFPNGLYDITFNSKLFCKRLMAFFEQNNKWGWRETVFLEHSYGPNQFTLEETSSTSYVAGDRMRIVVGQPFNVKHRESQFSWIVTDNARMMQYSATGKHPKPQHLMASLTTIVVDVQHTIDLQDGFHSLSFPPLNKAVTTLSKPIILNKMLGVDAHLYDRMGGDSVHKHFSRYRPLPATILPAPETMPTKFCVLKAIKDLTQLPNSKGTQDSCGVCGIAVWESHYLVQHELNFAVVCKFCAHFDFAINTELNTLRYNIYVCESATTQASIMEICGMPEDEKRVIKMLHAAILKGCIEYISTSNPYTHGDFTFINKNFPAILRFGCCVGVPASKYFQDDVMEQIHKFAEGTYVFEYINEWL